MIVVEGVVGEDVEMLLLCSRLNEVQVALGCLLSTRYGLALKLLSCRDRRQSEASGEMADQR